MHQGPIGVWETASGKQLHLLKEHLRDVVDVAFMPDGKTLVSAGEDHTIHLWHLASGRSLLTLRGHDYPLSALTVTPDGCTIVSGDRDGLVQMWQAPAPARVEALRKQIAGGRRP
jgi:WD40 repeat protein